MEKKDAKIKEYLNLLTGLSRIISSHFSESEMLDKICRELVNSRLYNNALIIRKEELKGFLSFSYSGEAKNLKNMETEFEKGFLPFCALNSDHEECSFATESHGSCSGCVLRENCKNFLSMCVKLKSEEKSYGYLLVNIDSSEKNDPKKTYEYDFLSKIGADIIQGLKNIEALNERNLYLNEIIEYTRELKAIYNSLPMVMAVVNQDKNIVKINSFAEKIYKENGARIKNLTPGELFCCRHRNECAWGCGFSAACSECAINKSISNTFESKEMCSQVEGLLESEAGDKNILVSTSLLNHDKNEFVLVLIDDITVLKKAEKKVFEKKANLTQLVDNMKSCVVVYEYDPEKNDFIIKDFSKSAQKLEKVKKEDVIGKGVKTLFPGVVPTGLFDCFLNVFETGIPRRFPVIFYSDSRISGWRDNYVYRLENKNVVAVYDDITDQKVSEEKIKKQSKELKKKEKEYREIFNNSPVGIFKTTIDGRPVNINPAMANILGCKNVKEAYDNYKSLAKDLYIEPEKREEFVKLLSNNKKVQNFVYQGKTKDNRTVWLEMSASLAKNGRESFVEGFTRDITKEYKALTDLRISEEKFSKVFMLGSAAMSISDLKTGQYIDVNPSFTRLTGYSKDELIGFNGSELGIITKETRDRIYSVINTRGRILDFEIEFFNKNGEKYYGLYSGDILLLNSSPSLLSTVFDITERKIFQQEAIRAGQLALIGELAAGVAHEINNPINGIINYAQILSDEFEEEGRDNDLAFRIIKEGERISKIAGSLLNFAGNHKEEFVGVNIWDILRETLYLAEVQIRKDGINLINEFPENLPVINGSPRELQQVFFNILLNSRYALNEKYPRKSKDKVLKISGDLLKKGKRQYVVILISDSGMGILPEDIGKIKSPFFTTKPKGKGTGLGLSLSSSIIERHFGSIEIESVFKEYTNVRIELPVWNKNTGE
ncbi:MAG: PAS domain S-box protein [Desulfobacteraceae bacterium]|nr:PAS domain S-box protein [Desulfobacteraceae bacterium]